MEFKSEMCMLVSALVLFGLSAFLYSYQASNGELAVSTALYSYPYRSYALTFVGFGSLLTLIASVSFSKRSRNLQRDRRL